MLDTMQDLIEHANELTSPRASRATYRGLMFRHYAKQIGLFCIVVIPGTAATLAILGLL